jgi:hypothetical protein
MTEHDHDVEGRFHALRREDAAAVPPFQTMLAAARARGARPPHRRMLGLAAAAAVIAGVAVAFLSTRHARRGVPGDLATVRLETPTDFLLALPNENLLRTVPELGRVRLSGTGLITTN